MVYCNKEDVTSIIGTISDEDVSKEIAEAERTIELDQASEIHPTEPQSRGGNSDEMSNM